MPVQVDFKAVGARIRGYRKDAHITQEELAEMTDLSCQFIGNIERGFSIPSVNTLFRI